VDVVIVGAGLAGLSAGRALLDRQASVVVLEARDRVGGRTLSQLTALGDTVDLGAQWIGPTQDRIAALVKEFGLATLEQHCTGTKVLHLGGKRSTYAKTIPSLPVLALLDLHRTIGRLETLCRDIPLDDPSRAAHAAAWDGITVESWKREHVHTAGARAVLDVAVRAVFACEPADVSFLHFLFYLRSGGGLRRLTEVNGGAQQTRLVGGTQEISRRLAALLGERVVLEAPVRAIEQDAEGVRVRSAAGEFRARYAIVAVPPVLAGRIEYSPALPATRDQLTQRMPMGSVIKCIAVYERPFWRDEGFSGEALSDEGPIELVFDDSPADGSHGALVGFSLGNSARQSSAQGAEARRSAVLAAFARFFGPRAANPVQYLDQDWSAETWTRGCYAALMPPGVLRAYGSALRTPVGRVHWAGTETATVWNGYMDGALESGARAAAEVLAALAR
jgi:monoamine oxidase